MSVYHITWTEGLKEICLFMNSDGGCNFSCHGCVIKFYPLDTHLMLAGKSDALKKRKILSEKEVLSYLSPLSYEKVIFLGKEPSIDKTFVPLAKILKENFSTYNIMLTNGYEFVVQNIDEVCISIKAITKEKFKNFTDVDDRKTVLENFKKYVKTGIKVRTESVFIPNFIDNDEIEKIAKFIASVDKNIPYRIDGYIPYQNDIFRAPTKEEIDESKNIAKKYLNNVTTLHKEIKVKYKVKEIY
ncbi:conserved hypothetical protein [groundwater metagenome]|uniref:Radical SAM core domain-containing protein n=1 Tax=groundwater metagenome TaxID=717931 RepID=A0A098EA09_9ZZZZ